MALVNKTATKRVEVHDGWIDVRVALSMGEVLNLTGDKGIEALSNPSPAMIIGICQAVVVAWSYEEPVTAENVALLDMETTVELFQAVKGVILGDEKKEVEPSTALLGVDGLNNSSI